MIRILPIVGSVIFLLVILMMKPFEIVNTGHRGVEVNLGKVVSESLPEGLYFFNPITTNIYEMDIRTIKSEATTQAYTKDIQQSTLTYTVNFNLSPTSAHTVYQTVGVNWENQLVKQVVEGTLKTVIGKYDAVDLISNRDKARGEIEESLKTSLAEKNVIVSKFEITNIDYNDEFEKAVEAKVTAVQRAAEAQNKTVQIREEANQKIITAEAEAKSMKIKSEALSQNQNLVAFEAVQKWDGKMPVTMLGDTVPFINIKQ